jgi:sigma-B regulation protein RsbU (phosphoserine phosphatase)
VTTPGKESARDTLSLVRTLPGRLFILSSAVLLLIFIARLFAAIPDIVDLFRKVARLAWLVSLVWLGVLAVARHSGRFLWRVRQKLILSYVFLGFVPVLLVVSLSLVGGLVVYINVAAYMFNDGFSDIANDVNQIAESVASEVTRAPAAEGEALARKYLAFAPRYPKLSLAAIPTEEVRGKTAGQGLVRAGPWRHAGAPASLPEWLSRGAGGFRGVVAVKSADSGDWTLVVRSVAPIGDTRRAVVADLPVDPDMVAAIEAKTQTRIAQASVPEDCGGSGQTGAVQSGTVGLFRQTVAFLDCRDWLTGQSGQVSVFVDAPISRLYSHIAATAPQRLAAGLVLLFVMLGLFFVLIQGAALFFGAVLARSITYAVHELFTGTERVQQGDFTHRIRIQSDDQLGELAGSYNRMSASIEHLLHVQREKQRLDDELRIAREIQKSLLPPCPPTIAGISIADLCEPAREVGGDYYDFFELGPRQIGVMIADVSGKGTSAALYMAELKGMMLALSHNERSPRRLMVEANRLLSGHLDNRSFITMTYMVIDLEARTLTCARAGHTPLLVVSGGVSEVVIPSGMVLGLRLPGATERFSDVLEEHTRLIKPGDVFVLYTDGISEAMDADDELFSDERLARVVESHHGLDAPGIRERVVREVRAFVGDGEPHDDMTMIVVKIGEPELAA